MNESYDENEEAVEVSRMLGYVFIVVIGCGALAVPVALIIARIAK